jgi:hypothetical protein
MTEILNRAGRHSSEFSRKAVRKIQSMLAGDGAGFICRNNSETLVQDLY